MSSADLPACWRLRELPGGVRVDVPGPRYWPAALFLSLWLLGWAAGEASILRGLLRLAARDPERGLAEAALAVFWLSGWTAGGFFAAGLLAWMLAGMESLEIAHGWVRVKVSVFGIGKSWQWEQSQVRAVRLATGVAAFSRRREVPSGLIEVLRADGRHLFGFGLSRPDAEALLGELRARCLISPARDPS